jgi:K+ transport systems, NAD-binding component
MEPTPDIFGEAGVAGGEMLISATPSDEIIRMACQVAHSLSEVLKRIARVRDKSYLNPSYQDLFTSYNLPVNIIISPEKEVAKSVFRRCELPGAFENVPFGDNNLRFLGIKINQDCPIKNAEIGSLTELFLDLNTVIVGLRRNDNITTPKFNDKVLEGDLAYLICPSDFAARTLSIFGYKNEQARRIVLVGGGSIGKEVGKLIASKIDNISLRIIEKDENIAEEPSDKFDKSFVIPGSGMDKDILNEAEISNADLLISLTNSDETNFISAAFAKTDGCDRMVLF